VLLIFTEPEGWDERLLYNTAEVHHRMADLGFAVAGLLKAGITPETDPGPEFPLALLSLELNFLRDAIAPELALLKKARNL